VDRKMIFGWRKSAGFLKEIFNMKLNTQLPQIPQFIEVINKVNATYMTNL